MNKALRLLLLLIGLTTFICSSCSKDKDFPDVPDLYDGSEQLPFNIKIIPVEGCDTLFLYRIIENNDRDTLDLTDTTLVFNPGDSLVLETHANNGYTFINWVRNGRIVSNDPIYGFKLDTVDIDTSNHVKYHYEARFGLDYALQVIPPIDSIIPAELIKAMGRHLHFGDTPPRIDTCFIVQNKRISDDSVRPAMRLARFVHNHDDPTTTYYKEDSTQAQDQQVTIRFSGQHRCIAEHARFVHYWGEVFPENELFEECTSDTIYIMGMGDFFTAYYRHKAKKRISPDEESYAHYINDFQLIREEWFIISGQRTDEGIADCRIGTCVKGYSEPSSNIGVFNRLPAIHDIIIYDFPYENLRYDY